MLLPLAGGTVNFTALPYGAVVGTPVNEAPLGGTARRAALRNAIQSRFWPSPEKVSRITCVPVESETGA